MKDIKTHKIPNTALLFVFLAPFVVLYYMSYVLNFANAGNIYLYFLQIVADGIAMMIVCSLWITIILDIIQPEHNRRDVVYDKKYPEKRKMVVDVFIPVTHEPLDIISHTVTAARDMEYPHKTYILDDGPSADVENLAKELEVAYIARPLHAKKFAKSGNINFALLEAKGDFFAVFDADHVPRKNFLTELLPFFENEKVGLVQTPQHYINTDNFIASGTAQAQEIFYRYVQPAKNSYNASFCVGTNMIYRRKTIDEVGGIARRDHSEDIWTTILIHENGWESVFYNKVLAVGRAPETIGSFFRQQNRWARGGFTLFFQKNPLFVEGLTLDQKLQYFFSNIHYFSGIAILIYLSLPLIYLLTGAYSMNIFNPDQGISWLVHYIPYALIIYLLPLYLLGNLKFSTISTAIVSFVPYMRALLSTLVKNKYKWLATEAKTKKSNAIMLDIWPLALFMCLSVAAIFVGWYNPTEIVTTTIMTFWTLFNMYVVFVFIRNGLAIEL